MIIRLKDKEPQIAESVYLAPNATVIGDVKIGPESSVWFGAVIRGDNQPIRIGSRTNIQDNCTLHCNIKDGMTIGDHVTIGHNVVLHSCTVGNHCLIGMGAVVMDRAVIGENSIVGAGALVTPGKTFPPNSLIVGSPARVKGPVSEEAVAEIQRDAEEYMQRAKEYASESSPCIK